MKNHLIVHGHFYQPPREEPWTGLVPYQESAHPYHDWNHRITEECYAANCKSRILDSKGLVVDILNNFTKLSFNFGPTLMNWLKDNNVEAYKAIIEADKVSQKNNNGHGNAIAQSYNHTILPLCSEEDARTQIIWGLKDFESHFGRPAEGMWLPEAGVNESTVDLLIECGVKFIVLSPWQAEAICPVGTDHWQPLDNNPIPTGRAYKMERPGGELNLFFYNHVLAHGISFEHYLRNADQLYDRTLSFRQSADKTHLINVATDGEVYGHHEPFGDMCMAAFSKLVDSREDFYFTNYGKYLEEFPPTYHVKLKKGEAGLGTSWSCVHGVSRWYKNCGCTTGGDQGWNQGWRTPLRNSFNYLNEQLLKIYNEKMGELSTRNPYEIRNSYIDVLTGAVSRDEFAKKVVDKKDPTAPDIKNRLFALLEGQKFAQFMFTSCGWFFSEISGLEGTQNLKYAVKAMDLYEPYNMEETVSSFLAILENARSNISAFGSGRNLVETWILPERKNLEYGAAIFALNKLFGNDDFIDKHYGIFKKVNTELKSQKDEKETHKAEGEITVEDFTTFSSATYSFSFNQNDLKGVNLNLTDKAQGETHEAAITDLPIEMRKEITDQISLKVVDKCICSLKESFEVVKESLNKIHDMKIHGPETIKKLAELMVDRIFEQLFNDTAALPADDELVYLEELIAFCQTNDLKVDVLSLKLKISKLIAFQVESLKEHPNAEPSKGILKLLKACRAVNLEPEITEAQDTIFQLLRHFDAMTPEELENPTTFKRISRLIKLGSQLGLNVEEYKEKVFDI